MEKKAKIANGLDSLLHSTEGIAAYGKNEIENIYQIAHQDIIAIQNQLDSLQKVMIDSQLDMKELVEKRCSSKAVVIECQADDKSALLPEGKGVYHLVLENQLKLIGMKEKELCLQRNYQELIERVTALREVKARTEQISVQMSTLAYELSGTYEVFEDIKVLVRNQNSSFNTIKAQEEERRRVAREIHDGPAQAMANVVFLAEVCERLIGIDPTRAKRELGELRDQVRNCLTETRKIIFDLRPMTLDDLGLIPTVKRIADMVKERTGIQIYVKLSGTPAEHMDSHIELGVFRVIQESLNNIEKHSNAVEAQIFMEFQNDYVAVIIEDNGNGFDVMNNYQQSGSFGLMGMRERVNLLGGELEIHSQKGRGTRIAVIVPIYLSTEKQQSTW